MRNYPLLKSYAILCRVFGALAFLGMLILAFATMQTSLVMAALVLSLGVFMAISIAATGQLVELFIHMARDSYITSEVMAQMYRQKQERKTQKEK